MDIDLSGQVAVVTGAGRGIGLGIAEALARHGARICLVDIDRAALAEASRSLTEVGHDAFAREADVTDEVAIEGVVADCLERHARIDILVNNAGTVSGQMVEDMPLADWRRVIDVNLTGPFICSRAVLPAMKRQGSGKIVNISSPAARRISYNGGANYTASKAGLHALTRHLAYEVAGLGINVNAVSPGTTETTLVREEAPPGYLDARRAEIPRGRLATAADTANAVLFLVSDMADYVCGAVLDVDGGVPLGWYDVTTYRKRRSARHE